MSSPASQHVPVLLDEIVQWLAPTPGMILVDGTLGGAGHTRALAERVGPSGRVIGLDRDPLPVARARETLGELPVTAVNANYCDLRDVLDHLPIAQVDGIVLDLGLSSDQLADRDRGFSFDADGSLDLRFDTSQGQPASELVNRLPAEPLANLIYELGEERLSRRIARRIVDERERQPITTAGQLAEIVRRCYPPRHARGEQIHPATRTFQALRIAVNNELGSLDKALASFPDCLKPGGRLAIISFHSLEDRRVKYAFRDDPRYTVLTRKPIVPGDDEQRRNPRSRSAKLRVAARANENQS
ncbi:MAG: 16S rRNA (cytosine(1402)-N(4))-methyltransferase RsmH [Planctomycetes bacterium]|nr:16S rRNA (cytosine(1402)-N(4))-methyltransferase RsmH [Planctomycetota bacterium]